MSGRGRGGGGAGRGGRGQQPSSGRGGGVTAGHGGRGRGGGRGSPMDSNVSTVASGSRGRGRGSRGGRGSPAYNVPPTGSDIPSLSPNVPPVATLSQELEQKLNIQTTTSTSASTSASGSNLPSSSSVPTEAHAAQHAVQRPLPPASSKARRPPARPGFGTVGRQCIVRANHFLVEIADKDLHHYDVSIAPEIASKKVSRSIMSQLVSSYQQSHLGNRMLAYDGSKSAYAAGPLPFTSKEFVIKLSDKNEEARKEREFKVSIKFATKVDLYHLQQFLNRNQIDVPQETIQALDIVLRGSPSLKYEVVGRSFFSPSLGAKGGLGEGLEYWKGFYQSLRPTQMGLSLNVDISARSFYEPILVTEFISKYLNIRISTRPLSNQDCGKLKKVLRGIKVETNHQNYAKRYKVSGIAAPLNQLSFPVVQYFRERYNIVLKYTSLPAIQSGSDANPVYLPMEICRIVDGQRYTRKLNDRQVSAMLKATCQRPAERERNIKQMVVNNDYNTDQLVHHEFGIEVLPELTSITARVLPPPTLKYHETGRESRVDPRVGQWNMINKKMVNGGNVDYWTCISFSRSGLDVVNDFCKELVNMCQSKGMRFGLPFLPFQNAHPGQIERALVDVNNQSIAKFKSMSLMGKQLQLLIVILPDVSGSYGTIKRICETELGMVSQCCKPDRALRRNNIQYLENVALKINVKVGGRNTVLEQAVRRGIPFLTDCPTIIFGADVTHPQPGEDAGPSIAAVVASMDWPEVTKYRGLVSAQRNREEIIQDLYKESADPQKGLVRGGMIRELLIAFYRSTSQKPHRIIFYRDGVSEGQFNQVLLYEIDAIRKACNSLQEDYQPRITFVVVQKRHHTRLFPANHGDRNLTDRSGNILPGTVVDTKICHPMEFDFYLCSHAGIQGTSRPTHYHVLYDENNFTANALQTLTNNLCYTYARCTRSVSVVPPAYYAHLAAFRARYYIEGETSDSGSTGPGGASASREREAEVRPLPAIKDNVKEVMFYC